MEQTKKVESKISDLLQIAPIALDSYDDIFSDFDPSPFEHRFISEDFLSELHRRYVLTPKNNFVVHFTIPKTLRSDKIESLVKRRIKDHFRDQLKKVQKQMRDRRIKGFGFVAIGLFVLITNLTINSSESLSHIKPLAEFFLVVSWYFVWTGLGSLFEQPEKLVLEQSFLEKFSKSDYVFVDQEQMVESIARTGGYL